MNKIKKIIFLFLAIVIGSFQPAFAVSVKKNISTKKQVQQGKKPQIKSPKKKLAQKKISKNKTHKLNQKKIVAKKTKRKQLKPNTGVLTTVAKTPELVHSNHIEKPSSWWGATLEQQLVEFVHKTVATLRYSAYQLGGKKFDTSKGVYIVDCSSYVGNVLQNVYPNAFSSLANWSGSEKPTTYDYYNFITSLPQNQKRYWTKIDDVKRLKPGDILVFRYKNSIGNETGGHVMIVMDKPVLDADAFQVRVADAANTGHSEDTRMPNVSGIGVGTLLLKVNPKTYQPSAYAWKVGSKFKNNAYFAMARPLEANKTSS